MKNNQFKRIIRERIESCCEKLNITPVYVDVTNNERMVYLYATTKNKYDLSQFKTIGTLSIYLNNEYVRLRYSSNKEKVTNIVIKDDEQKFSYMELNDIVTFIDGMFSNFVIKINKKVSNTKTKNKKK